MLLTFSKHRFVDDIQAGRKIHTIRADPKKRWRAGMPIHWWFKSPRVKGSFPFLGPERVDRNRPIPQVTLGPVGACTGVEEVRLFNRGGGVEVWVNDAEVRALPVCMNDIPAETPEASVALVMAWFVPKKGDEYVGRIIHWTDKRYNS